MAIYKRSIKALKVTNLEQINNERCDFEREKHTTICTTCRTKLDKKIPYVIAVDYEGNQTMTSFKMCPHCLQEISLILLDKLNELPEELRNELISKRFVNML